MSWLRRNRLVASVLFVGIAVIALANFTQSLERLVRSMVALAPGSTPTRYENDQTFIEQMDTSHWIEASKVIDDHRSVFTEDGRDRAFVFLFDPARSRPGDEYNPLRLRIPICGGSVQWSFINPQEWTNLYTVRPVHNFLSRLRCGAES
jgi:hypothetical protein